MASSYGEAAAGTVGHEGAHVDEIVVDEDVRAAPRRSKRTRWGLAAAVVAVASVVAVQRLDADGHKQHRQEVPPPQVAVSSQQALAIVYTEWLARAETSDCLESHGITDEPEVHSSIDYLPGAIEYLSVQGRSFEPAYRAPKPHSLFIDAEPGVDVARWVAPVAEGGCEVTVPVIDTADADAVTSIADAAALDSDFLDHMSDLAWRQEHPEQWLARSVDIDMAPWRVPLADPDAARQVLDRAVAVVRDAGWVEVGSEDGDQAVYAYGLLGSEAVVVVVDQLTVDDGSSDQGSQLDRQAIACEDLRLSVVGRQGAGFAGSDRAIEDLMDALDAPWCHGG